MIAAATNITNTCKKTYSITDCFHPHSSSTGSNSGKKKTESERNNRKTRISDWKVQLRSLSGSMAAQIVSLTKKSNSWATTILHGHLDWKIFWQGLHTIIWPSLCYPWQCPLSLKHQPWGSPKSCIRLSSQNLVPAIHIP